jgi:predicted enzyme related to lactoylglutathione lyase
MMSERDGYEQGTPSWVDHTSPDPEGAARFYGELFGWEAKNVMPVDAPQRYLIASQRGRSVAGIGSAPPDSPAPPSWTTYVAVDDADEIAGRVARAGGSVLADPFDVFDAGRLAVLADPGGAVVGIWQAGTNTGAELVNEPGALTWNELNTRDPDAAAAFYGEVFGWRAVPVSDVGVSYTVWHLAGDESDDPGTGIGGMIAMSPDLFPPEVPPHWLVYFGVEEAPAALGRAQELGASVVSGPFETPGGPVAVLTDPTGAAFAVVGGRAAG